VRTPSSLLRERLVACGLGAALALNLFHLPATVSLLPAPSQARWPSSDALLGPLGLDQPSARVDDLLGQVPDGPGVVVVHASPDPWLQIFHAVAARTPRAASLVACPDGGEAPFVRLGRLEGFTPVWRMDLRPGTESPLSARALDDGDTDVATLCRSDVR
jgi:hypothetical protein